MSIEAVIVVVGTEMLTGLRSDTNSRMATRALLGKGIRCRQIVVVADEIESIAAAIRRGLVDSSLVIVSGGLGPTHDDLTREAVAAVLGCELPQVESGYATPLGTEPIWAPWKTAPGIFWSDGDKALLALPGVPAEMRAMLPAALDMVERDLEGSRGFFHRKVLLTSGLSESAVSALLPADPEASGIEITILAAPAQVSVFISCREREMVGAVDQLHDLLLAELGVSVFATDTTTMLSGAVGALAGERGLSIAVAESCTGGAIASEIVSNPGSSSYFKGGVVAYSDDAKRGILGVDGGLLSAYGAVSEEVAAAMAKGVALATGADVGVASTGIAGPGGGSSSKPVGLVYLGLYQAGSMNVIRLQLRGDRDTITRSATMAALHHLRLLLSGA